jgi:hypothetical protein
MAMQFQHRFHREAVVGLVVDQKDMHEPVLQITIRSTFSMET